MVPLAVSSGFSSDSRVHSAIEGANQENLENAQIVGRLHSMTARLSRGLTPKLSGAPQHTTGTLFTARPLKRMLGNPSESPIMVIGAYRSA